MLNISFLAGNVTLNRIFHDRHLEQLRQLGNVRLHNYDQALTTSQLAEQLTDADIAITSWGSRELTEDLLAHAPNLKAVLHAAGTVKGIVTPEVWGKGIRVSSGAEALGIGVAETALGLTIASLKDMWRLSQYMREGGWGGTDRVTELYGIKVGVVGAGNAGRHYVKLMRNFEVELLLYDPLVTEEQAAAMGATKVSFQQLLTQSNVISIHAPALPETYRMFNDDAFGLMKDDCILINTARGAIIDEAALVQHLRRGRLFACLDVTDPEPPAVDHPFRALPNVVLLPHIAGSVNNGLYRLGAFTIGDLQRLLNGEPMRGEVTEAQLHTIA
ncbi:hydroxyacid dehydrogenase [Paenibacillus sp. J5C_2022]|uniref:hydroxyacid dehydrogenase n=1 Tax=Paenibacillus sp. J5C2022 TaxID=2977129 RepID=UPI0021D3B5F4|nr:hydroxyacid dehydrogenase [Paenibacillus sp. J5C2022]MCU6707579.1 hydroxyacid dehydrogenase [Paenibacillus sp. J5C2022]